MGDPNQNQGITVVWGMPVSSADVRIARECDQNSFYSRCVPLMAATTTITHYLVQTNKLKPHPKYGSFFKVCLAALGGHFLGKISYQSECREKFQADPNSLIGRKIRQSLGQPTLQPTDPQVVKLIEDLERGGGSSR